MTLSAAATEAERAIATVRHCWPINVLLDKLSWCSGPKRASIVGMNVQRIGYSNMGATSPVFPAFYFSLFFFCFWYRALDYAGPPISFWAHVSYRNLRTLQLVNSLTGKTIAYAAANGGRIICLCRYFIRARSRGAKYAWETNKKIYII